MSFPDNTQDTWALDDSATLTQSLLDDEKEDGHVSEPEPVEDDEDGAAIEDGGGLEDGHEEEPTQEFVLPSLPTDTKDDEVKEGEPTPEPVAVTVKRPQTAYFHFVAKVRDSVKAAHPDLGLGALQKEIASQWKTLSADEKKVYEDAAEADKARYAVEVEAIISKGGTVATGRKKASGGVDGDGHSNDHTTGPAFPLSRVRKICKLDPDVKIISKDALTAITAVTEVFLEALARASGGYARDHKRKQVRDDDIAKVIHSDRTFEFLRPDFPKPTGVSASGGAMGQGKSTHKPTAQPTRALNGAR